MGKLLRERPMLAAKIVSLALIVIYLLGVHPSIYAQQSQLATPMSFEDVKQDSDLGYMKANQATQEATIQQLQTTVIDQGKDLAKLDEKMSIFAVILGLLQGGGIALHLKKRT
jgi:uncharacterized coiled-coil protein SlyX